MLTQKTRANAVTEVLKRALEGERIMISTASGALVDNLLRDPVFGLLPLMKRASIGYSLFQPAYRIEIGCGLIQILRAERDRDLRGPSYHCGWLFVPEVLRTQNRVGIEETMARIVRLGENPATFWSDDGRDEVAACA